MHAWHTSASQLGRPATANAIAWHAEQEPMQTLGMLNSGGSSSHHLTGCACKEAVSQHATAATISTAAVAAAIAAATGASVGAVSLDEALLLRLEQGDQKPIHGSGKASHGVQLPTGNA